MTGRESVFPSLSVNNMSEKCVVRQKFIVFDFANFFAHSYIATGGNCAHFLIDPRSVPYQAPEHGATEYS